MFKSGYRKVALPGDFTYGYSEVGGAFDAHVATRQLVAENRLDDLLLWQIASRKYEKQLFESYLASYPEGLFANDARASLNGFDQTSEYPYDGRWRLSVDFNNAVPTQYGPDLCKPGTVDNKSVNIENSEFRLSLGFSNSTTVEAKIRRDGVVIGTITTNGYSGGKQRFSTKVVNGSISIPFAVDTLCDGVFVFARR